MKSILFTKKLLGLVEMTFGLVNASFSLPEWQAVKMIFFGPCFSDIIIFSWWKPVRASQNVCCFLRLLVHVFTLANLWRTTFLNVNFNIRLNRLLIVCHQVVFMYLRVHKVQHLYEAKDILMRQEVVCSLMVMAVY